MSKNERPFGDSSRASRLGQRLAGDDVAPDRDDPAAKRRRDAVRVAVGGHEHVPGEDRPALRLDDEPAVGLAPDRARPDALVQIGAGPIGGRGETREVAAGMEQTRSRARPARRNTRPSRSRSRISLARHEPGFDAHEGEVVPRALELADVRRRIRQLEVPDLAEVAVDRLVGDQPLDGLVAIERLADTAPGRSPHRIGRPALVVPTCSPRGRSRHSGWRRQSPGSRPRAASRRARDGQAPARR